MGSSATDTQRQITIAKSAKSICACRVYGDIGALESGCAVGSFDTLAAPRPAMRPRSRRINGGLHLGLRQRYNRASVEPGIDACALDVDQSASLAVLRGDGAKRHSRGWEDVCVQPPLTAEIDGKAATLIVCHGRPRLLNDFAAAGEQLGDGSVNACVRHPSDVFLFAGRQHDRDVAGFPVGVFGHLTIAKSVTVKNIEAGAVLQSGLGHFGLLPLISRGAEGKQSASHELNYTHKTKERKNYLQLFFGRQGHQAKPSNA